MLSVNVPPLEYCTLELSQEFHDALVYAVKNHYWYQMYIGMSAWFLVFLTGYVRWSLHTEVEKWYSVKQGLYDLCHFHSLGEIQLCNSHSTSTTALPPPPFTATCNVCTGNTFPCMERAETMAVSNVGYCSIGDWLQDAVEIRHL